MPAGSAPVIVTITGLGGNAPPVQVDCSAMALCGTPALRDCAPRLASLCAVPGAHPGVQTKPDRSNGGRGSRGGRTRAAFVCDQHARRRLTMRASLWQRKDGAGGGVEETHALFSKKSNKRKSNEPGLELEQHQARAKPAVGGRGDRIPADISKAPAAEKTGGGKAGGGDAELEQSRAKIQELERQLEESHSRVQAAQQQLDEGTVAVGGEEQLQPLRDEVEAVRQEAQKTEEARLQLQRELSALEAEIGNLRQHRAHMQDRMRELSKEKARLRDMLDAADARRAPRSPDRDWPSDQRPPLKDQHHHHPAGATRHPRPPDRADWGPGGGDWGGGMRRGSPPRGRDDGRYGGAARGGGDYGVRGEWGEDRGGGGGGGGGYGDRGGRGGDERRGGSGGGGYERAAPHVDGRAPPARSAQEEDGDM